MVVILKSLHCRVFDNQVLVPFEITLSKLLELNLSLSNLELEKLTMKQPAPTQK